MKLSCDLLSSCEQSTGVYVEALLYLSTIASLTIAIE